MKNIKAYLTSEVKKFVKYATMNPYIRDFVMQDQNYHDLVAEAYLAVLEGKSAREFKAEFIRKYFIKITPATYDIDESKMEIQSLSFITPVKNEYRPRRATFRKPLTLYLPSSIVDMMEEKIGRQKGLTLLIHLYAQRKKFPISVSEDKKPIVIKATLPDYFFLLWLQKEKGFKSLSETVRHIIAYITSMYDDDEDNSSELTHHQFYAGYDDTTYCNDILFEDCDECAEPDPELLHEESQKAREELKKETKRDGMVRGVGR